MMLIIAALREFCCASFNMKTHKSFISYANKVHAKSSKDFSTDEVFNLVTVAFEISDGKTLF